MVNNVRYFFCLFIITVLNSISFLNAQTIDPTRSNRGYRREVMMNSNNIAIIITNNGCIGKLDDRLSGQWPKDPGYTHPTEISILAGADVAGADNKRYKIFSESNSFKRDENDTGKQYCWNPKPGYYKVKTSAAQNDPNISQSLWPAKFSGPEFAHSADRSTWPDSWPGKDASWNGKWNSYFGKNQLVADDEAYFVADDFDNSEFPYYPFASDTTKRGLGLQCAVRVLQFADPNAEDQLFMHFIYTNASDNDYDKSLYLGAFGSIHTEQLGTPSHCLTDDLKDMFYTWSADFWLDRRFFPFYAAFKLLESPGFSNDGIDNDQDGITDENNKNDAGEKIVGSNNIIAKMSSCIDIPKFLKFYGYKNIGEVPAVKAEVWWTGDENADWEPGTYGDDIGSDGIGPLDPSYVKPDADGTEGNGRPDQGEPHFGMRDRNESDQLGFTSFAYFVWSDSSSPDNDEAFWNKLQPGQIDNGANAKDGNWVFVSGPLTLEKNQSEKFSAVLIYGKNEAEIYKKANMAQLIYNLNYLVDNTTAVEDKKETKPVTDFTLEQNYPNPFNPSTTISFSMPKADNVSLKVYDLLGHEIAVLIDNFLPAGTHRAVFDAAGLNLPSGMYVYQLKVNNYSASKKMTILK